MEPFASDVARVRDVCSLRSADSFVIYRTQRNIDIANPVFDREEFWLVLLGCLLTTQQKSTVGSPVDTFIELRPFPLSLEICGNEVQQTVETEIKRFGRIRFGPKISKQAADNAVRLNSGLWSSVETYFNRLADQRGRTPKLDDRLLEREAARFADIGFAGIGPKQSRNLWQWLGLTRYETPLDSRIAKWVNGNLSFEVNAKKLGDERYYESVLDKIQDICAAAEVLRCLFDACAFDYESRAVRSTVLE